MSKPLQGVFNGDPILVTNKAWRNRGAPIRDGNADIYIVSSPNAGFEGGYLGSNATLNNLKIVTEHGTNRVITAHPIQ